MILNRFLFVLNTSALKVLCNAQFCLYPVFPINSFSHYSLFVLFRDPLSLTRTVCVTVGLELPTGACWAQQWVHNKDNASPFPRIALSQDLSIANSSVVRGGAPWTLVPRMTNHWQGQSCAIPVQVTMAAVSPGLQCLSGVLSLASCSFSFPAPVFFLLYLLQRSWAL